MGVTGSEWPKWSLNGPSALDTFLVYFFEARAISNGYHILEG